MGGEKGKEGGGMDGKREEQDFSDPMDPLPRDGTVSLKPQPVAARDMPPLCSAHTTCLCPPPGVPLLVQDAQPRAPVLSEAFLTPRTCSALYPSPFLSALLSLTPFCAHEGLLLL